MRFVFIFLLLIGIVSCGTGNKSVFEENTDISIPSSAQIVKDEYQDMMQDYVRILHLKLNNKSKEAILLSVLKSVYFNSSVKSDSGVYASQKIQKGDQAGIWYRYQNGFRFLGSYKEHDNIYVNIDTVKMIAEFEYFSD